VRHRELHMFSMFVREEQRAEMGVNGGIVWREDLWTNGGGKLLSSVVVCVTQRVIGMKGDVSRPIHRSLFGSSMVRQ
jgi:hypothetical protein